MPTSFTSFCSFFSAFSAFAKTSEPAADPLGPSLTGPGPGKGSGARSRFCSPAACLCRLTARRVSSQQTFRNNTNKFAQHKIDKHRATKTRLAACPRSRNQTTAAPPSRPAASACSSRTRPLTGPQSPHNNTDCWFLIQETKTKDNSICGHNSSKTHELGDHPSRQPLVLLLLVFNCLH